MNISEIIKDNPELTDNLVFKVTGADLKDYAIFCFEKGKKEISPPQTEDELLTPDQFAERLKVSKVTLWHWDRKGLTSPIRIGNAKRYRRSDLENLINEK